MGAGKTTVGGLLAERLGWCCVDLDREIERRAGSSIARIFRDAGEDRFRELEAEQTTRIAASEEIVLATGGGWAAQRGLWERLASDTLFVWLRVAPHEALGRIGAAAGDRPLLEAVDPEGRLGDLLRERTSAYARAKLHIDTSGRDADSVAADIERAVRFPAPAATSPTG
ncbi:shikimate kinase [soil metagenome]